MDALLRNQSDASPLGFHERFALLFGLLAAFLFGLCVSCSQTGARPGGGEPDGGQAPGTCRADGACLLIAPSAGPDSFQNPCFSPDGRDLVFTVWHGGYNVAPAGLFVVPLGGGAPNRLLDDGATNVNLPGSCWSGAAARIAYASDRFGADEILTIDPRGALVSRVTRHSGANYIEPSFSPDGGQLVFEADLGPRSSEIWIVRSDGGGAARLTSGSQDRQPNWSSSPASAQPVLFQRMETNWSIFVVALDGSAPRRVTPPADSSTDAAFSPDGTRIVYSNGRADIRGANLFVIPTAGGAPQRLTTSDGYDGAPSWSPDGKLVAFESSPAPSGTAPTSLWVIAAPP